MRYQKQEMSARNSASVSKINLRLFPLSPLPFLAKCYGGSRHHSTKNLKSNLLHARVFRKYSQASVAARSVAITIWRGSRLQPP